MTKDHSVVISPPVLLPGETLILQQDKVTCVNTLSRRATGALHLTNYRIIFTGEYMQVFQVFYLTLYHRKCNIWYIDNILILLIYLLLIYLLKYFLIKKVF